MAVNVAISGFGRIGRLVLRSIIESKRKDINVVAINDLAPIETNAFLLSNDTVHGPLKEKVTVKNGKMIVGKKSINVLSERDPKKLPWKKMKIDVALECTGFFTSKETASMHITAGARKVLVSAPCSNADKTIVFKFVTNKKISKESINKAMVAASKSKRLKGILNVNSDPLVSSDFNHNSASSSFDLTQTQVIDESFGRVLSWYDNEWGFSNRMCDTAVKMNNTKKND